MIVAFNIYDVLIFKFEIQFIQSHLIFYFTFEITNSDALESIEVECNLLTEVFDAQNNIIQINDGNGIKSMLLDQKKTVDIIQF